MGTPTRTTCAENLTKIVQATLNLQSSILCHSLQEKGNQLADRRARISPGHVTGSIFHGIDVDRLREQAHDQGQADRGDRGLRRGLVPKPQLDLGSGTARCRLDSPYVDHPIPYETLDAVSMLACKNRENRLINTGDLRFNGDRAGWVEEVGFSKGSSPEQPLDRPHRI